MNVVLKLAYKLLVGDTAKFTALLIGVTFAVFLMLQMTAIFSGVMNRASAVVLNIGSTIGVATANLFPNISLSGDYGVGNAVPSKLFNGASGFWDLGSHLTAPIFHGGTLLAERQAAIDTYTQAGANYKQTVLAAFAQVADSLRALEHDAETVQAQSEARATAEENLHLTQANYQAGLVGDTQVLIANAQYLQADLGYIQAIAQRLQDTVALFVALGGGWQEAKSSPQ